jgi:5-formyltetrahydrofolate cyclo-ligase
LIQKIEWRKILTERRKAISPQRREEAARLLVEKLRDRGTLLSFTPIGSEIDIRPLNQLLAAQKKLFLVPYTLDLPKNLPLDQIDFILVSALGFDRENYRMGHGKGYYDRFLATLDIPTIGIGFKEQFCEELFPRDPWDIPVKELILT